MAPVPFSVIQMSLETGSNLTAVGRNAPVPGSPESTSWSTNPGGGNPARAAVAAHSRSDAPIEIRFVS